MNKNPMKKQNTAGSRRLSASLRKATGLSAISASLCMPIAQAQILEEVIVTAQKKSENLQDTPISISAFNEEALSEFRINALDDIARTSPSVTFAPYPTSNNLLIMYIRGQGVGDPAQITIDGSVGIYLDGFYLSRPQGSTFDLADLERVEVLRGPQGTLYGRNTTGGAVNLISRQPSGEFRFNQKLTFGSRDEFRSLSTFDFPEWRSISTKLSILASTIDGYVDNPGDGEDFGMEEELAGRFDARWEASDNFSADLIIEAGRMEGAPNYHQNPAWNGQMIAVGDTTYTYHEDASEAKTTAYRPVDLRKSRTDSEFYGLTLNWDISDSLTLRSLTGYRDLEWRAFQDFAEALGFITSTDPNFPLQPFPISFESDNGIKGDQFSQEFNLLGENEAGTINYVAGLYYFKEENDSTGIGQQSAVGTVNNIERFVTAESESYAAYGQFTWSPAAMDSRLHLTLGGRYTYDKRSAGRDLLTLVNGEIDEARTQFGAENDDDYDEFNPSFSLAYDFNEDINAYLRVATGYKAGGSSESAPVDQFSNTVDPETVTSYELGIKSYLFNRHLRLNAAIFESQFEDMQFNFGVDPQDASVVQSYNAGEATIRGVEADLTWQPIERLNLSLQYAYLDTDLEEVIALPGTIFDPEANPAAEGFSEVGDNIASSFTIPYAPEHSVLIAADANLYSGSSFDLRLHVDYRYQSSVYGGATAGEAVPGRDNLKIESYGTLNARLSLAYEFERGDYLEVAAWGENVLDEEYRQQVIGLGSVAPVQNQVGQIIYGYVQRATVWAQPARFGIDINYRY